MRGENPGTRPVRSTKTDTECKPARCPREGHHHTYDLIFVDAYFLSIPAIAYGLQAV